MQGDTQVKQQLNQVLRSQLTAINQYFLHARMSANWGLGQLSSYVHKHSIKAMKQADELIERILFLEGLPNLQDLGKLYIGEDVEEILANNLRLATEVVAELRQAIQLCEVKQDYISRHLLKALLDTEEEHVDWLETQQWLISHSGLPNYLQSMLDND